MSLSTLEKEKTHKTNMELENCSIFLLVAVTGTIPEVNFSSKCIQTTPNFFDKNVGTLQVQMKKAEGLPKLSGSGGVHCVLELDNSRLETQSVSSSSSPIWDKTFTFEVQDIYSCLLVTIFERDKNMKSIFLGRISIPLVNINNGTKYYLLKDKTLRYAAKGQNPEVLMNLNLNCNFLKASLLTFTPRKEIFLSKSEKFKRRLFNDNLSRVKLLAAQAEETYNYLMKNINWTSRWWVLKVYFIFLLVTYFFELWMVPLSLAVIIVLNHGKLSNKGELPLADAPEVSFQETEITDVNEVEEQDNNVSLNKIMQMVHEAFPMIQNCLGQVASYSEKIKNTINFSVPILSNLAIVTLIIISLFLMIVDVRTLIMIVGSVKFIKNLVYPGIITNNELLDFLSRVPDDKMLLESKEIEKKDSVEL